MSPEARTGPAQSYTRSERSPNFGAKFDERSIVPFGWHEKVAQTVREGRERAAAETARFRRENLNALAQLHMQGADELPIEVVVGDQSRGRAASPAKEPVMPPLPEYGDTGPLDIEIKHPNHSIRARED